MLLTLHFKRSKLSCSLTLRTKTDILKIIGQYRVCYSVRMFTLCDYYKIHIILKRNRLKTSYFISSTQAVHRFTIKWITGEKQLVLLCKRRCNLDIGCICKTFAWLTFLLLLTLARMNALTLGSDQTPINTTRGPDPNLLILRQ